MTGRVLHCIPGMGGGGAERQLSYLAGELVRMGWDVHVALVSEGPNFARLRESGATLHRIEARGNYDPRLLTQLVSTIARVKPDLIQVWVLQMEVLGAIAARFKGVPWILSERCSEEAYPPTVKHRLRAGLAGGAAAVVSNSAGGDAYWSSRLGDGVRRYVIPNALPLEEIEQTPAASKNETGLAPDEDLVLFAGRLTRQKNPDGLVRALAPVLSRERTRAVIAGEGPMRESLAAQVRTLGLEDRIRLPGFVGNIWGWMKRAAVFVSPTLFEGHPNAVLEAMACRAPLVASDIPPHRAFLDERCALLIPSGDDGRLSDAIVNVLTCREAAAERAERAHAVVRRWSTEQMAREYDRVYREVLGRAAAPDGALP